MTSIYLYLEDLKWDKNRYVNSISNINPDIENHNNIYSIIDLPSML
jgi:hypothetical protein